MNNNNTDLPLDAEKDAHLHYQAFKKKNADDWLRKLQAPTNEKKPSMEQLQFIQTVVTRCIQEANDERNNAEYRSEPLRLILHGVPGDCFFVFATTVLVPGKYSLP